MSSKRKISTKSSKKATVAPKNTPKKVKGVGVGVKVGNVRGVIKADPRDAERVTDIEVARSLAVAENEIRDGRIQDIDEAHTHALIAQEQRRLAYEAECEASRVQDIDAAHEEALFLNKHGNVAVSVREEVAKPKVEDERMPKIRGVAIPLKFIQAALLAAAKSDVRYYLNTVYIHGVDGEFRIAATDGHRMIVSRFKQDSDDTTPIPDWAEAGILIKREELAQALPLLARHATAGQWDTSEPRIYFEKSGKDKVTARTANGFASFKLELSDGTFPKYAQVFASNAAALARTGDSEVAMRTTAINTIYLKATADIAMKLGAKAVSTFASSDQSQAVFFTFDGAPDTVLVVMPMRVHNNLPDGVIKIIGRDGMSLSIAALKAHQTRVLKSLPSLTGDDRKRAEERAKHFGDRIAEVAKLVGMKSLPKAVQVA